MSLKISVTQANPQTLKQLYRQDLLQQCFWVGLCFAGCFLIFFRMGNLLSGPHPFLNMIIPCFSLIVFLIVGVLSLLASLDLIRILRRGQFDNPKVWIAKSNNKIVARATIMCTEEYSMLLSVDVKLRFQRKKIGSQLVSHLAGEVKKPLYVIAEGPVKKFYAKLGFIAASQKKTRDRGGEEKLNQYPNMMVLW